MGWTEEEQRVADELTSILASPDADGRYDALPGSRGGKILNADLARDLCPQYRTVDDRIAFTRATYPPCSKYVFDRLRRTLGQPVPGEGERAILFLAGGAASGKTTSIGERVLDQADLVLDSNFADPVKARVMVDTALDAGWLVQIFYIHRNYRLAVDAMLDRAVRDGRYIPLRAGDGQDLASLHLRAQRTIVEIDSAYAGEDRVDLVVARNPWTPDNPLPLARISIGTLSRGGKRHYTDVGVLYADQTEIVERYRARDLLSQALLTALNV